MRRRRAARTPARKSNWSPGASNAYRVNYPNVTDLPLQRNPHDFLLPRVWELRNNLTADDAIYVALAEALDVPVLTRDQRLAASSGHQARIEPV
jgi:predicted nucleic acid-binding protein